MSKFLIGYIVGDCYGKSIDEDDGHLIYNYSFYGFKVFDSKLQEEMVISYIDLFFDKPKIYGLDEHSKLYSKHLNYPEILVHCHCEDDDLAEFVHLKGIDEDTDIGDASINLNVMPLYDKELNCVLGYSDEYIALYSFDRSDSMYKISVVYDTCNNAIDLEFCGFSALYGDLRYLKYQFKYSYYLWSKVECDFEHINIIETDNIRQYNSICIVYGNKDNLILPSDCKAVIPIAVIQSGYVEEFNFDSLVLSPNVEYIGTLDRSRLNKLALSKSKYKNIKVLDLVDSVLEEHKSLRDLKFRLWTIASELVYY